jgi:hypothetical protein
LADVKEMTAREVLQALAFESFVSDYEKAFMELNNAGR